MDYQQISIMANFNPRTPRGVRRNVSAPLLNPCGISIHAPREGCDNRRLDKSFIVTVFQSTHPARGATIILTDNPEFTLISIHAPREGCDTNTSILNLQFLLFQSTHPARGATSVRTGNTEVRLKFQSTHPARGATCPVVLVLVVNGIFQSTHPARGATVSLVVSVGTNISISIHAPREGCDDWEWQKLGGWCNFNPRTPRGVRQQTLPKSREFAWLNLLICTRGRRLSIQKQTRLCSIKLSFMLFGCEPAGEGVSSWTSHATKSKVRLEGRSA